MKKRLTTNNQVAPLEKTTNGKGLTVDIDKSDGTKRIRVSLPEEPDNKKALAEVVGTESVETGNLLLNQMISVLGNRDIENLADQVRAMLPVLKAIAPKDEIEGLMAVQMVGVHSIAMKLMRQYMRGDVFSEHANHKINQIVKINRVFIAQLDALNKHRGKGQQKVTVEHIHLNNSQAVIGGDIGGGGE